MADHVTLTQSPNWQAPDIYFEQSYGKLDARASGGAWHVVGAADGAWSLPFIEHRHRDDACTGASPYGYAGIHVDRELDPADARAYWLDTVEALRERGLVSLFLRFHPLDPGSVERARAFAGLDVVRTSSTFAMSIGDIDSMWARIEGRARTEVRKAEKSEMTAEIVPVTQSSLLGPDSSFRVLYTETMQRAGAASRYFFNDEYFASLAAIGAESMYLAQVRLGKDVVASSIIMRHGHRAHYHLSGSDRRAARLGANSLMLWTVLKWCAGHGVSVFHLGGGVSEGDSLARFKRSFSDRQLDFFTGRAVIDDAKYEERTRRHAANMGVSVEALEATGYFPAFLAEL